MSGAGLQRSVTRLALAAIAGMLYSNENIDVRSMVNAASTLELYTVTVDSATDTEYTLTYTDVNGTVVSVAYDQGAAGTTTTKVTGLVLAFNQSDAFRSAYATATGAATFTITARVPENAFTLAASAQMTAVNTTDASAGSSIPFGRAVAYRNVAGNECKLGATVGEKNLYTVLVGGATDGTYVLAVQGVTFTYTASSAGSATVVRDGLIDLIRDNLTVMKTVSVGIKDADEFYIEGLEDGVAITVVADNTTGTGDDLTVSETNEEVVADVFAGVALLSHTESNDVKRDLIDMSSPITGTEGYNRGASVNVLCRGRVWVTTEEAVTPGQPVYVRYVAGASESQGVFRKSADSTDCVKLDNARWVVGNSAAGLAVVELL